MADSKNIDDGGLAFPGTRFEELGDDGFGPITAEAQHFGLSKREWFATHAPEPTAEEIASQMQREANLNPHNDYHKPARRGRLQIIADLKFAYADAMIAASRGGRS